MYNNVFEIGAASLKGSNRKINQDKLLIKVGEQDGSGEFGMFAVADGMGGLSAGEKASNICIEELDKWWSEELSELLVLDISDEETINLIGEKIEAKVCRINEKVISFGNELGKKIGTTLTVAFVYMGHFLIKHIGDSRVYFQGEGSISVLTLDHSWVGEQLRSGVITPEEARNHPEKNILTQCIGVRNDIEINTVYGKLGENDALLLCSDGFYNVINDSEIQKYLRIYKKYRKPAQNLVDEYFSLIEKRDGPDDASVIVLW